MSLDRLREVQQALTPKTNKFICVTPTAKQTAALLMNNIRELLYGGAAGGGKSVFQLDAALQYVDVPGYNAILFRKTFSDLMLPGALIPMSKAWLGKFIDNGTVKWYDKDKRYVFVESEATLSFGYLDTRDDHYRYQGAEFQYIGLDEVTHINPESYTYLFSRLRRLKGVNIPLRIRSTANPGGMYSEFYYHRFFVDNLDADGKKKRIFLQAGLNDNPHLDADEYRLALAELDPITRDQLENGNWEIRAKGDIYDKSWIMSIDANGIPQQTKWVRFWDLASIDPKFRKKTSNRKEPDWTVGFKLGMCRGVYYIADIIQVQKAPGDVEALILATAQADGYSCAIRMEEEGGSSGVANTLRYAQSILQGYDFQGVKPVVSKIERARPVASACQTGSVFISNRCRGLLDFYAQLESFPNGSHDDIMDGFSGAFTYFKPRNSIIVPPSVQMMKRLSNSDGSYWRR